MVIMEHRNGCTGCDHDPSCYPPCWTHEQVQQDQQRIGDMVRLATLSEHDRAVNVAQSIEDAIKLEHMRHANELERLHRKLELAHKAVSHTSMHQGR